jgi:carbamoyl-phosphate synthase large subunit
MKNVLVTGAGCPGFFATVQMLKSIPDLKVFSCDPNPSNSPGPTITESCFQVPLGSNPHYITTIQQIVKNNNIDIIIPLTDPELLPLASHDFGCDVWVSPPESITILLDKLALYKKTPRLAPAILELDAKGIQDYVHQHGSCFVKLHTGHGSRGTKKLIPKAQWLNLFSTAKPESYGSIFPVEDIQSIMDSNQVLFVENLPGEEYSVDCVFNKSDLIAYGVRNRALIKNGICQNAVFERDPGEFHLAIKTLFQDIPVDHNINVQLKRDSNGQLKLLEVNPRVSGSLDSFSPYGLNLLDISLRGYSSNLDLSCSIHGSTSYRVSSFIR